MKTLKANLHHCVYAMVCIVVSLTVSQVLAQTETETRGIGQYPGSQDEYFAPSLNWLHHSGSHIFSNIALHRAAWASSTRDYNHTAHLVTDGCVGDEDPAILTVSTPFGTLPRREAEWTIDGGPFSRNVIMGSSTWLQYDWSGALQVMAANVQLQGMVAYDDKVATHGYAIRVQTSYDGEHWQTVGEQVGSGLPGTLLHYKLHSDPNKQEAQDYLPARVLNERIRLQIPIQTQHIRLLFEMEGAAHWDIREVQFLDVDLGPIDVMPSTCFSSMWISEGGGEQDDPASDETVK